MYVATPDRQVTAYAKATGVLLKSVTLNCAPTLLVADGSSMWVGCGAARTVLLLNANLGIDRTISVGGPITAMSIGGKTLYVAIAGSTQLVGIGRLTGALTRFALAAVPRDLNCTATGCWLLLATGGTKVANWSLVTSKLSGVVSVPSWATKISTLGTNLIVFGPGSATALRLETKTLKTTTQSSGEGILAVSGSAGFAYLVTAHHVIVVNLTSWKKIATVDLAVQVKAASGDGATFATIDAASPWVRLVSVA